MWIEPITTFSHPEWNDLFVARPGKIYNYNGRRLTSTIVSAGRES